MVHLGKKGVQDKWDLCSWERQCLLHLLATEAGGILTDWQISNFLRPLWAVRDGCLRGQAGEGQHSEPLQCGSKWDDGECKNDDQCLMQPPNSICASFV